MPRQYKTNLLRNPSGRGTLGGFFYALIAAMQIVTSGDRPQSALRCDLHGRIIMVVEAVMNTQYRRFRMSKIYRK